MSITTIYHGSDADLDGTQVAVVGYGNQGRPWALNLRDSGIDVTVCVRADATRDRPWPTASPLPIWRTPTTPMSSACSSPTMSSLICRWSRNLTP